MKAGVQRLTPPIFSQRGLANRSADSTRSWCPSVYHEGAYVSRSSYNSRSASSRRVDHGCKSRTSSDCGTTFIGRCFVRSSMAYFLPKFASAPKIARQSHLGSPAEQACVSDLSHCRVRLYSICRGRKVQGPHRPKQFQERLRDRKADSARLWCSSVYHEGAYSSNRL